MLQFIAAGHLQFSKSHFFFFLFFFNLRKWGHFSSSTFRDIVTKVYFFSTWTFPSLWPWLVSYHHSQHSGDDVEAQICTYRSRLHPILCYYLAIELLVPATPLMNNEQKSGCSSHSDENWFLPLNPAVSPRRKPHTVHVWCSVVGSPQWAEKTPNKNENISREFRRRNKLDVNSRSILCNLKDPTAPHEKVNTSGRNFESFILWLKIHFRECILQHGEWGNRYLLPTLEAEWRRRRRWRHNKCCC